MLTDPNPDDPLVPDIAHVGFVIFFHFLLPLTSCCFLTVVQV